MNIWLEDFGQNLEIAGFKDVQVKRPDEFFQAVRTNIGEICVQFFDALSVAGFDHLRFAALNALNAFRNHVNISNNLAMETLLYASARGQIREALNLVGIKPQTKHVVVLIIAGSLEQGSAVLNVVSRQIRGRRDDSIVDFADIKMDNLMKVFNISDLELEAQTKRRQSRIEAMMDLIIEHMALLVTQL